MLVIYTKFTDELPKNICAKYLSYLPTPLQLTNSKYFRWQDRTSNLLGKMLLIAGLKKLGLPFSLHDLKFNPYNKPYINDAMDFSISHSGNYVVCAISKGGKLGVDIEEAREVQFSDFKQVFTEKQFELIKNSSKPYSLFFKLWTIKESVVKADGRGLSLPLHQICIKENTAELGGREWFIQELCIAPNYSSFLASCQKIIQLDTQELSCINILHD